MRNFLKFTFIVLISLSATAQVPTATLLSASAYFCTDAPIFFAAKTAGTATSFTWTLPSNKGASFISGANDSSMVCRFSTPGILTLSLTASNGSVSSTFVRTITVTRSATASFNANLSATGFPTELSLTNYSNNSIKNYWQFSNSPLKDSTNNLQKLYNAGGSYTVTQIALGTFGCNDTLSYAFRISDSSGVKLPNIFSPNGDDVNDLFKPITRGISSLKAWVYNRYGTLITSWDRVNGFWDDYTTSGLECKEGEYFVILEATGFDGKSYKLKSSITLVR